MTLTNNNGGPHDNLVRFFKDNYYQDKSHDEIQSQILANPQNFNSALETMYNDRNKGKGTFDGYRQAYIEKFGDPFKKKSDGGQISSVEKKGVAPTVAKTYSWTDPSRKESPLSTGKAFVSQAEVTDFNSKPKEERQKLLKEHKQDLDRLAYEKLQEKRKGNYALTGDELTTPDRYTINQNKRKTLAERALYNKFNAFTVEHGTIVDEEGNETQGVTLMDKDGKQESAPRQKTLAEYEYNIANIQSDLNDLNGAIPHLYKQVTDKYGEDVFRNVTEMSQKLQKAQGKDLSEEEIGQLNKIHQELTGIQEDPFIREYMEATDLYERNIKKAKELIKQDDYQFVKDINEHYDKLRIKEEAKSRMIGSPGAPFGGTGPFMMKLLGKTIAKIGASGGAVLDWGEAMTTGDEEYSWFDEMTDLMINMPDEIERTFPTPSRWSRPLYTETITKNGFEYDIAKDKLTNKKQIQAIRTSDGTIVDKQLTEKESEEILAMESKSQFNSSGLIYKGAEMGIDLGAMILLTKGVGTTLGGSKAAYQTGVVASTMGQMTGDLYKQGLEDFDGDQKKAGLYALLTAAGIGIVSNLGGVEARLAGGKVALPGEKLLKGIKNPIAQKSALAVTSGLGEALEESVFEQMVDSYVRIAMGETPQDVDWKETAETALLSFAMGAISGGAASNNPVNNDLDNASILILAENNKDARDIIEKEFKKRKGTTSSEDVDPDAERLINRIDKTSGKLKSVDIPEGVNAEDVAGALFDHTVAQEELEKAKSSKIAPLIAAKEAQMEEADLKVAEVLQLTTESPVLKEGEEVKVKPMKKPKLPKKEFEPQTKEDVIADWFASGGRVGLDDYVSNADINDLTNEKGRIGINFTETYINRDKGTDNLDTLAESLSESFGSDIKVQDIVDFIREKKKPKTHIKETTKLQQKAESYNMSPDEYAEYDSNRQQLLDQYVGDVEATPQALESVGDVLMNYSKDGKVDLGEVEPEIEKLDSEPSKILTDAINRQKDQALSYSEAKKEEIQKAKETPIRKETPIKTEDSIETPEVKTVVPEVKKPEGETLHVAGVDIGKVPRKRLNRAVKKIVDNTFKSRGQLPKDIFKLNIKRKGKINASMYRVQFDVNDLNSAIKKEAPKELKDKKGRLTDENAKILGDLLKDKNMIDAKTVKWSDGSQVSDGIIEVVGRMRNNIDAMSNAIKDSGLASDELQAVIDDKLNFYVHRSYRVHNDPKWLDKVEELDQFREAVAWAEDKAVQLIEELKTKYAEKELEEDSSEKEASLEHLERRIERAQAVANDPRAHITALVREQQDKSQGKGGKMGAKNTGILKKKNEKLPGVLRDLYGEYVDPITTYSHSIFKMTQLLENHKFLESLKDWGMGKVFFKEPTGNHTKAITQRNEHFMSPLADPQDQIYTTPEIAQAMEMFDTPWPVGPVFKQFLKGMTAVKYAKTILSPATQMRNFVQNIWFHYNNGHFHKIINPKGWKDSADTAWASMGNWAKGKEGTREEYQRMVELGIFDESSTYGEIRSLLSDVMEQPGIYNPDDPFITRARKRIGKKAEGLYAFGDDSHKYFAYLLERQRYAPALKDGKKYDDLNEDDQKEVDEYVADIIRDTYQTYSMISPYVKELRKLPITGTFISFTYEMYRNTKNNMVLGVKEMARGVKEDNPKLRNIGMSRFAGTTSMYLGLAGLANYFFSRLGLGDDDDLRWFLPPWDRQALVFPVHRDGNNVYVISAASTIPEGKLMSVFETALDGRKNAAQRVEGMFNEAFNDFITPDILSQHVFEAAVGEKLTGAELSGGKSDPKNIQKRIKHVAEAFYPGAVTTAARIMKSFINPERDYDKLNPLLEIAAVVPGVRVTSINLDRVIEFPARDFGDKRKKALKIYRSKAKIDKYAKMNLSDRHKALASQRKDAIKAYNKVYTETAKMVQAARRLGIEDKIIRDALKNAQWTKEETWRLISNVKYEPLRGE